MFLQGRIPAILLLELKCEHIKGGFMNIKQAGRPISICLTTILTLALMLSFGCNSDNGNQIATSPLSQALDLKPEPDLNIEMTWCSDCKSFNPLPEGELPPNQTALEWEFDGEGTLIVRHINAALDAPPEPFISVSLTDREVTIREMPCPYCYGVCLADREYRITGLSNGKYVLRIDEMWTCPEDPPLECEILLKGTESSGRIVVSRTCFPWSDYTCGALVGFHSCGIVNTSVVVPDELFTRYCFTWEYDGSSNLTLGQHNAMINCCLEELGVTFDFSGSVVTIDEVDTTPNYCYCFCAYGAELEIYNLSPGTYTFVVNDPYYTVTHQFTVDLINEPMGYYAPFAGSP